ncbi:MAG: DUF72 domain-containing protein [Candidatus Methylomirabilales bacterium]
MGVFYPDSTAPADYLKKYAEHFDTVEVDSTFYRIPTARMVDGWAAATAPGFVFAAKVPQVITHEKRLQGCEAEVGLFLERMGRLGEKCGPLIFQFEYTFRADQFEDLAAFLKGLPPTFRYAVEVRHRSWFTDAFFGLLAEQSVALVLHDLHYMPRLDRLTADFAVIRLLGRRADVPEEPFDQVRINRDREIAGWAERIRRYHTAGTSIFAYANNRYQGHAPATVRSLVAALGSAASAGLPPA